MTLNQRDVLARTRALKRQVDVPAVLGSLCFFLFILLLVFNHTLSPSHSTSIQHSYSPRFSFGKSRHSSPTSRFRSVSAKTIINMRFTSTLTVLWGFAIACRAYTPAYPQETLDFEREFFRRLHGDTPAAIMCEIGAKMAHTTRFDSLKPENLGRSTSVLIWTSADPRESLPQLLHACSRRSHTFLRRYPMQLCSN